MLLEGGLAVGKERIVSLDFLKAIAILSVVMGHIASPFSSFIFSWHMPAFFVASGFLLGMRNAQHATTSVFSKKDLFHLGGYYLFFGALGITAEFFKDVALGRPILPLGESLLGLLYFMDMPHLHHYGFVLWFLLALFWGKIFTRGLFLYVGKPLLMLATSFLLFWIGLKLPMEIPLGFGVREGLLSVPWCVTGGILFRLIKPYHTLSTGVQGVVLVGGAVTLLFLPVPQLNLAGYFVSVPSYNFVYSSFVVFLILGLGNLVVNRIKIMQPTIAFFSRMSIYIMALHVYTNNVATVIIHRYHQETWWMVFILSCILLLPLLLFVQTFQQKWNERKQRMA